MSNSKPKVAAWRIRYRVLCEPVPRTTPREIQKHVCRMQRIYIFGRSKADAFGKTPTYLVHYSAWPLGALVPEFSQSDMAVSVFQKTFATTMKQAREFFYRDLAEAESTLLAKHRAMAELVFGQGGSR